MKRSIKMVGRESIVSGHIADKLLEGSSHFLDNPTTKTRWTYFESGKNDFSLMVRHAYRWYYDAYRDFADQRQVDFTGGLVFSVVKRKSYSHTSTRLAIEYRFKPGWTAKKLRSKLSEAICSLKYAEHDLDIKERLAKKFEKVDDKTAEKLIAAHPDLEVDYDAMNIETVYEWDKILTNHLQDCG